MHASPPASLITARERHGPQGGTRAPAYYLGRPGEWWITALSARRRRPAGENVRPHRLAHASRRAVADTQDDLDPRLPGQPREQILMWEQWWQANQATVPSTGPLRWVLTLDGHRLVGSHLRASQNAGAGWAS